MTTMIKTNNEEASVWNRLLQWLKAFDTALDATVRDTSARQG